MFHDFRLDTFDTAPDGKHYLWAASNPDRRFEVVVMLDSDGEETDDPDAAAGGVVKLGTVFTSFEFTH